MKKEVLRLDLGRWIVLCWSDLVKVCRDEVAGLIDLKHRYILSVRYSPRNPCDAKQ